MDAQTKENNSNNKKDWPLLVRKASPFYYVSYANLISRCLPTFMHLVQIFKREPSARGAHWRFGYFRLLPVGLNLVARTRLE